MLDLTNVSGTKWEQIPPVGSFLRQRKQKINTHYFGITTKFNDCLRVVSEEIRLRQA